MGSDGRLGRIDEMLPSSVTKSQVLRNSWTSMQCPTSNITINNFEILASANSLVHLRILESLYIYNLKPDLNENFSAFPLKIVNR